MMPFQIFVLLLQGPYQMLFSRKSPLFAPGLNLWYRILYTSPCYIYVVSAIASPTFTLIPVIFIWSGKFPAVLTKPVLGWLIAYSAMSSLVKFYVRPGRNFIHDLRWALSCPLLQQQPLVLSIRLCLLPVCLWCLVVLHLSVCLFFCCLSVTWFVCLLCVCTIYIY